MQLRVLSLEDVLVTKLLSLTEHNLDYASLLRDARAVREQVDHTKDLAERFCTALSELVGCGVRIGLLHYAPVPETLLGERLEIYPFLGSYLFAEAADQAGADLLVHGHAHGGAERGVTEGGIPVRNVAP